MRLKLGKICNSMRTIRSLACLPSGCCCLRSSTPSTGKKIGLKKELKLIYYTFFYNQNNDSFSALETFLFPFARAMTSFIKILGYFLVTLVWILMFNMLYVFYAIILPQLFNNTSVAVFLGHFISGSWLAVNTFFHYWMGATTNPGEPPKELLENVVSVCKKCVSPKPPRTHHCSVCDKCVLKMDHHCPWFNNCIGFYNHRYFFLFCVFIMTDCIYLATIGFHYFQILVYPSQDLTLFSAFMHKTEMNSNLLFMETYYTLTTAEFFVCFVGGIAVFGLAAVNGFIISHGSTNIEIRSIRIPFVPITYSNPKSPYDAGFIENWKIFLGFSDFKSFVFRVILPSAHKPLGDGIDWSEYYVHSSAGPGGDEFIV